MSAYDDVKAARDAYLHAQKERLYAALRRADGLIHVDRALGNDPKRFDAALAEFDRVKNPPEPEQPKLTFLQRIWSIFK